VLGLLVLKKVKVPLGPCQDIRTTAAHDCLVEAGRVTDRERCLGRALTSQMITGCSGARSRAARLSPSASSVAPKCGGVAVTVGRDT
jgi:hypothetical protein